MRTFAALFVLQVFQSAIAGKSSFRFPYYYFDDFGGYYGRVSCPFQITGAPVSRNQRLFNLMTSETDCIAFKTMVRKSESVFKRFATKSHPNQIKALSALLFHSSSLACPHNGTSEYAGDLMNFFMESSHNYKNYFKTIVNPTHYLAIARDIMSVGVSAFEEAIQVILKNAMGPVEFAIWMRVVLLSARSYDNFGFILDGIKNAMKPRIGVHITPDLAELVGEVYLMAASSPNSIKKTRLLGKHAEEMMQLGFADLMISAAAYLEMTVDNGMNLAEVILGEHFQNRPRQSEMFPAFDSKDGPYLLHAPLFDDDINVDFLGPTRLSIRWKQHQGRNRKLDLTFNNGMLDVSDSTFLASLFILRQNSMDDWDIIDLYASSSSQQSPESSHHVTLAVAPNPPQYPFSSSTCSSQDQTLSNFTFSLSKSSESKLRRDDILVFLDAYPVDQSELMNLVMHKKSIRETALMLQASLYDLKLRHHVMLIA